MIFYLGALNLLAQTLAKERNKVTDHYWLEHPYWPILFILEYMMFIRFGKASFYTGRKLEACQKQNLSSSWFALKMF